MYVETNNAVKNKSTSQFVTDETLKDPNIAESTVHASVTVKRRLMGSAGIAFLLIDGRPPQLLFLQKQKCTRNGGPLNFSKIYRWLLLILQQQNLQQNEENE